MKLCEEFKLFESMWESFDEPVSCGTTSYFVSIDGEYLNIDSNKQIDKKGITKRQAFKEITNFVTTLSDEEISCLQLNWCYDMDNPGDCEGDAILTIDGPTYFIEDVGMSVEDYKNIALNGAERVPQNWFDCDNKIVGSILEILGLSI
jgi:hypothetical protein